MNKKLQTIVLLSLLALGGCATGGFSPDAVSYTHLTLPTKA